MPLHRTQPTRPPRQTPHENENRLQRAGPAARAITRLYSPRAATELDAARTELFRLIGAVAASTVDRVDAIPLVFERMDFEGALRVALERRTDLTEAECALCLQQEGLAEVGARFYPSLSGYAVQRWAKPDPKDPSREAWSDAYMGGRTSGDLKPV